MIKFSSKKNMPGFGMPVFFALISLAIIFYAYKKFNLATLPAPVQKGAENTIKGAKTRLEFSESKKDSLRKLHAGFWIHIDTDSAKQIRFNDHIELKENGYVWEVRQYTIKLPSGATRQLMHIVHGYCNPFSYKKEDSTVVLSDFSMIRQVWIADKDTCYSQGFLNQLWQIEKKDKQYIRDGNEYKPYLDTNLANFFPDNIIRLIDDIRIQKCPVPDVQTTFFRDAIIRDITQSSIEPLNKARLEFLLQNYFIPCCILTQPNFNRRNLKAEPFDVTTTFSVNPQGGVTNLKVTVKGKWLNQQKRHITEALTGEISAWKFPSPKEGDYIPVSFDQRYFWELLF